MYMATTYTTSQVLQIPNYVQYIVANIVASGGRNITTSGGSGAKLNTIIPRKNILYPNLYLSVSSVLSGSSFIAYGSTNSYNNLLAIAGAGGGAGVDNTIIRNSSDYGRLGGNGGFISLNGEYITNINGLNYGNSGYLSAGYGGDGGFDISGNPISGNNISGGNGSQTYSQLQIINGIPTIFNYSGSGGGGGYGGGGGGGSIAGIVRGNGGALGASGQSSSGLGGNGIINNGIGGSLHAPGGSGFCGGGGGGYSLSSPIGGGGGGGSSFSFFPATFESANNSNIATGSITIEFIYYTLINSIADWNSFVNTNDLEYNLTGDIIFDANFIGNLLIGSGKLFDGYNNTIYLNNINNFNGLFNLNSGDITTTIKNLKIIISNVSLNDNKGYLVEGSQNGSITANGTIENIKIVCENNNMGNNCGGLVGASAQNIIIKNSFISSKISGNISGNISGINSGGFIGNNCSNVSIYNSYVRGNLTATTGGLVGNNSTITNIKDSYFIGNSNNNGITLSGSTILNKNNVYAVDLQTKNFTSY
jgi:hypothetical protein